MFFADLSPYRDIWPQAASDAVIGISLSLEISIFLSWEICESGQLTTLGANLKDRNTMWKLPIK